MSNVTALPTSPSSGPAAPAGSWRIVISCGSWSAPCAIAANAPMPAASISARPITSTCTPSSSRARAASASGVSVFAGALPRSRARLAASAPARPASTDAATSWWAETTSASGARSSPGSLLNSV